jgi:serine O-acetyltransferase
MRFYRFSNFCFDLGVPLLPKLIEALIFVLFNSRIPSCVRIGKGSSFSYQGLSTLLVKGTVIGENCVIGMRVTTARKFPYKNVPNIGNNVWIGVNSVLLGPIIIEDNVIIAPNSLVNKSVPSGKIVAGNPAIIIGDVRNLDYDIFSDAQYKEGFSEYLK